MTEMKSSILSWIESEMLYLSTSTIHGLFGKTNTLIRTSFASRTSSRLAIALKMVTDLAIYAILTSECLSNLSHSVLLMAGI